MTGQIRHAVRVVLVAIALSSAGLAQERAQRPLTADDLFQLEELGEVALSPDGRWLAYVLKRPRATSMHHKLDFLGGNDRGDVWLVPTAGGPARNLTNGAADGSGYWAPIWSPDSERLTMLSTKGGNVLLWVWEKASGRVTRLTERAVDAPFSGPAVFWLSNTDVVAPVLPEGERPSSMTAEVRAAEIAMREWPKTWKGQETTASVLESGKPSLFLERPQGALMLIDAVTGRSRWALSGYFRELQPSPDRRYVAFLKQVDVIQPVPGRLLQHAPVERYQAGIVTAAGEAVLPEIDQVREVVSGSLSWSPDSAALAWIAHPAADTDKTACVYTYHIRDRAVSAVAEGRFDPAPFIRSPARGSRVRWSSAGDVLVLATATDALSRKTATDRRDWWQVDREERVRNLTGAMKAAPVTLLPETGSAAFVGLSGGEVFRFRTDGSAPQNLTERVESPFASVSWPSANVPDGGVSKLVLGVQRGRHTELHLLDLLSGEVTARSKPSPEASLVEFAPTHRVAVFRANDRTGTYLWLSTPAQPGPVGVVSTNTFLRGIAEGGLEQIKYRGLDGQDLEAWIILPVGYREGTAYPLVTWVYAGTVMRDTPPRLAHLNVAHSLNLQLLAAHGYAVLLPSMPLRAETEVSDPYMEMTKGVLPAVDKAVALGIADPNRLGVMGQSYGGYSTYALVTQTNRFKAAVALAGVSDLVSLYGQLDARYRRDLYGHELYFRMSLLEAGQARMGNPPWKDLARYVRNSPLYYVERVETPLMIVQGDMDYVALQQGEQFFTALHRQNKRAAFVRYWGEGHVLEAPANVRDMWQRVYAWFDEFLGAGPTTAAAAR